MDGRTRADRRAELSDGRAAPGNRRPADAAGPVGRDAGVGTDSRAKASIYSYSMSEGAYIGITIKGATINVNRDANKAYWNKKTEAKAALSRPATSKMITPLIAAFKVLIQKAD